MKKNASIWMEFAARDLEAARKLIDDDFLSNIVIFHSQQCIEKCLKAIIEERNQDIPKIHSINKLYELVMKDVNTVLRISNDELDIIGDVSIDTGYPGSFGLLPSDFPAKNDANNILNIAIRVYVDTIKSI